ncbi:MAG: FKBP-type peptidyl-prolyl cis-trans isomerase [Bacteroidales bacterium]|nr:FKBP-type peptidyl-prolyl cis-trans isomerase [Bacteroidales bacterium]
MEIKTRIFALLLICLAGSSCLKEKLEEGYNKQETSIDSYISKNPTAKRSGQVSDTLKFTDTTFVYDTSYIYEPGENGVIDTLMIIDTTERYEYRYEIQTRDTTWTDSLRVVYHNGSTRLVWEEGTGPMLDPDGSVSFYYAGYTFSGSINKQNLFVTNHQETAEASNLVLTDADYELYEINLGEAELIEGLQNGLIGVRAGERCDILFSGKYAFGNNTFGIIPANSALAFQIWVVGVSND